MATRATQGQKTGETSRAKGADRGPKRLWATIVPTAEGYAGVAASSYGLVACTWHHGEENEAVQSLTSILDPLVRRGAYRAPEYVSPEQGLPPHLAAARPALVAYSDGDYDALVQLEIDPRARTPFFSNVYRVVQAIPAGQVLSYGEVARRAGNALAARAVGQAMATNPLAPVVPCHRVIAADGRLGGFGPGLPAKVALLRREGVPATLEGVEVGITEI